jgi:Dehydrogenases (flavoproteins)
MWEIHGAGISGAYLFRRLRSEGVEVAITDPKISNFYIPCGFATNRIRISSYLKRIGIDIHNIEASSDESVTIEGNNFPPLDLDSTDICTIDKMKFESLLLQGVAPDRNAGDMRYGYHVDATGISRAFLPHPERDKRMFAIEKVCDHSPHHNFYFYFFPGGRGYFWSFPVGDHYHIGAGGIDLDEVRGRLWGFNGSRILSRNIRMAPIMTNIHHGNIVGVGESIGYISPLLGEGIIPGLESAEMLAECILRGDAFEEIVLDYEKRVLVSMRKFEKLAKLVENIQSSKVMALENLTAVRIALSEAKNFGINIKLSKVLRHFL